MFAMSSSIASSFVIKTTGSEIQRIPRTFKLNGCISSYVKNKENRNLCGGKNFPHTYFQMKLLSWAQRGEFL